MFGKDDDVYEMSIEMKKPVQCNNKKTTILCIKKHIEHKSLIEFLKTINHFAIIIFKSTVLLFNASVYLKIYLITDLLLCSQELIVHHICSIILIQSSINIFCVNPI